MPRGLGLGIGIPYQRSDQGQENPYPVPADALLALFLFTDGAGTTLTDATGARNGTISNGVWTGDELQFNGTSTFVSVPTMGSPAAWTMSVVANVIDNALYQAVMGGSAAAAGEILVSPTIAGKAEARSGGVTLVGNPTSVPNLYHHMLTTYEAGNLNLFVDGVLLATSAGAAPATFATGVLGVRANMSLYMAGDMAFAAYRSAALSPAKVTEEYDGLKEWLLIEKGIGLP